MKLTTRNRRNKPAHLLGLPAELRNKICGLALISDTPIGVAAAGLTQPPLLRACRQTREEALSVYYCDNAFGPVVRDLMAPRSSLSLNC